MRPKSIFPMPSSAIPTTTMPGFTPPRIISRPAISRIALEYYEKTKKLNPAYNEHHLSHQGRPRKPSLKTARPGKKDSLLRKIVNYVRDAFEK